MKLPGLDRKVRVALDWTLDLIFSKDIVQFVTERAPTLSHETYGSGDPGQVAEKYAEMSKQSMEMKEFQEAMKGYHDLVVEGRREIHTIKK
jgi:hypothetical protein